MFAGTAVSVKLDDKSFPGEVESKTLNNVTLLSVIGTSAKATSYVGAKGDGVIVSPASVASVKPSVLKLKNPDVPIGLPATAFNSAIVPEVDVSQKISSSDSTGSVSYTPKSMFCTVVAAAGAVLPIALPFCVNLAKEGFVTVW